MLEFEVYPGTKDPQNENFKPEQGFHSQNKWQLWPSAGMGSRCQLLGWVRFFLLHTVRVCALYKEPRTVFLGWELGCSMINENIVSLLFGPQTKGERTQHMCFSCAQNSPEVTDCLQAKVGMPCLAFQRLSAWTLTSDLNVFSSQNSVLQPHPMGSAHFSSCSNSTPLVRNLPHYSQQS